MQKKEHEEVRYELQIDEKSELNVDEKSEVQIASSIDDMKQDTAEEQFEPVHKQQDFPRYKEV